MDASSITASQSRDEFLQLLVTQVRHQDPLSPIQQEDMLSQLAQFSALEGIENLNANFERFLALQQEQLRTQSLTRASDLIGRDVMYEVEPEEATAEEGEPVTPELHAGIVDSVLVSDDRVRLLVNNAPVEMQDIREITY